MMFEQYLSLIRIFAVICSQAFPQVFATFTYLRTYEREKLCVGIHIFLSKIKSFVNTQYKLYH